MRVLFVDPNSARRRGVMFIAKEVNPNIVKFEASDNNSLVEYVSRYGISRIIYYSRNINNKLRDVIISLKKDNSSVKFLLLSQVHGCIFPPVFYSCGADGLISIEESIEEFRRGIHIFFETGAYIPEYLLLAGAQILKRNQSIINTPIKNLVPKRDSSCKASIIWSGDT